MFRKKSSYIKAEIINGKIFVETSAENTPDFLRLVNTLRDNDIIFKSIGKSATESQLQEIIAALTPLPVQETFTTLRNPAIRPCNVIKQFASNLKGE